MRTAEELIADQTNKLAEKQPSRKLLIYQLFIQRYGIVPGVRSFRLLICYILLSYRFLDEYPRIDHHFSRHAQLKEHGFKLVRDRMTLELLQKNWNSGKYRANVNGRRFGYVFIIVLTALCSVRSSHIIEEDSSF